MDDPRCCGGGACIIDPDGRCWCGQVWDGKKMSYPKLDLRSPPPSARAACPADDAADRDPSAPAAP